MNNEEQQQQQTVSWFLKPEIKEAMEGMEFSEQKSLLLALSESRTWVAVLKYVKERYEMAQGGLAVYDPVKEPTMMARCQGIMSGIMDLPEVIGQLVAEAQKVEDKKEGKE